jgi:hypothetical protein
MPSLSASFNIGSKSASSLIKSAVTISDQVNAYNDEVQSLQWDASAKTEADYRAYVNYLNKRSSNLRGTNSITNNTKAVEIQKTIIGAQKTFTSAQVQRASISVVMGNASLTDKYSTVLHLYNEAGRAGDAGLQQSLALQADQLSQRIQYQNDAAASATSTLAKATATKAGAAQQSVATQLEYQLKDLNAAFQTAGNSNINKLTRDWAKKVTPQLKALGVKVPNGAQPNYVDLVAGIVQGIGQSHELAATALATSDPVAANSYMQEALAVKYGITKFSVGGRSMSAADIVNYQENPESYTIQDINGKTSLLPNKISYVTKNPDGTTTNHYETPLKNNLNTKSGVGQSTISKGSNTNVADFLKKIGVNFSGTSAGLEIQATKKSNHFLSHIPGLSGNEIVNLNQTDQGLQFQTKDAAGKVHLYYLTEDSGGRAGVVEDMGNGKLSMVSGQYGFTPTGAVAQAQQAQIEAQRTSALLNNLKDQHGQMFEGKQLPSLQQVEAKSPPYKPQPLAPAKPTIAATLKGFIGKPANPQQHNQPTPQNATGGGPNLLQANARGSNQFGLLPGGTAGAGLQ